MSKLHGADQIRLCRRLETQRTVKRSARRTGSFSRDDAVLSHLESPLANAPGIKKTKPPRLRSPGLENYLDKKNPYISVFHLMECLSFGRELSVRGLLYVEQIRSHGQ